MRGEFIGVWSETWREIWLPLVDHEDVHEDIFCELYRALAGDPKKPGALKATPSIEASADIIDDPMQSRLAFEVTTSDELAGERELVAFLEATHETLDDLGGDPLANRYFNLLSDFIDKFSLRYDLRRPCSLCPTLPGIFTSLIRGLRNSVQGDAHLSSLMSDFEDAVRDIRADRSERRIKTCIQKQVNLLEALGAGCSGVTATELSAICAQLGSWPHTAVSSSLKSLYGFASDYPGIRHGGTVRGAKRAIDMRDMVAVSILLAGFTPYLTDQLDADWVYGGA